MNVLQDEHVLDANGRFLSQLTVTTSFPMQMNEISTSENDINEKKKTGKKDLRCVVCGGKAYGYNFNQITCESCKAFFRRNALKSLTGFHCRFNGNCLITIENRRHCTECRIRKCFTVGMRKEWIRSEEEKNAKRVRLETSRSSAEMSLGRQPSDFHAKMILDSAARVRLNNITHCYEQYTGEPSIRAYCPPKKLLSLRLHEFYNRKKPIIVNFVSYFKHVPEFQRLHVDDQVLLIKQNLHFLLPINYALLKTPTYSQFQYTYVQTIGCVNDVNLHSIYQCLSNSFVSLVASDPLVIKLLIITLFFTTNPQSCDFDGIEYKQTAYIRQTQSSYTELLWSYMSEKYGEDRARSQFTSMITKFLHIQATIDQIEKIIRLNNDVQYLDALMKTILQLT